MLEPKTAINTTASTTNNASTSKKLRLGIIGLGKMGGNLALQAIEKNIAVIGKAQRSKPDLERNGVKVVDDYESFVSFLDKPRVIYLSLPAGPTIDTVLKEVLPYLERGDVVMDGGNSFYLDSIRREKELFDNGIYFLDCGTSGGLEGATSYCQSISRHASFTITQILDFLYSCSSYHEDFSSDYVLNKRKKIANKPIRPDHKYYTVAQHNI